MRRAGATGQLTLRGDSIFSTSRSWLPASALGTRFSISAKTYLALRKAIEAIAEEAWQPIAYWLEGAAHVAETTYWPQGWPAEVRLVVRPVKPAPGSQLALFTKYEYHPFVTDREGSALELEADHRRHPK